MSQTNSFVFGVENAEIISNNIYQNATEIRNKIVISSRFVGALEPLSPKLYQKTDKVPQVIKGNQGPISIQETETKFMRQRQSKIVSTISFCLCPPISIHHLKFETETTLRQIVNGDSMCLCLSIEIREGNDANSDILFNALLFLLLLIKTKIL